MSLSSEQNRPNWIGGGLKLSQAEYSRQIGAAANPRDIRFLPNANEIILLSQLYYFFHGEATLGATLDSQVEFQRSSAAGADTGEATKAD